MSELNTLAMKVVNEQKRMDRMRAQAPEMYRALSRLEYLFSRRAIRTFTEPKRQAEIQLAMKAARAVIAAVEESK